MTVVIAAFTPNAVPADVLAQITVGRDDELGVLDDAFRAAAGSQARPNVLVVGPRGSGKTHLLKVAEHHIRTDPSLAARLTPVRLPEDAYRITSYRDLVRATVRRLPMDGAPARDAQEDRLRAVAHAGRNDAAADLALEQALVDGLDGRVLVWMVENFDRLSKVMGVPGQRRLRAFLQNRGQAVLVASTPSLFWGVSNHEAPFYGAFRVVNVGELTVEQGRDLLVRVAELNGDSALARFLATDRGLRRLRAVADLAGGLPRLWHLLAGCMTVDLLDELAPLFVKLLDQLNPYYKARLDELSPAKAKLLDHLCGVGAGGGPFRPGGARTVTDLASAADMTNQAASKQPGELERDRFVRSRKVPGADQRTTYYEVVEPLLPHCLELKQTGGGPLSVIVSALRDWHEAAALRVALVDAPPATQRERYLLAALDAGTAPPGSDALYSSGWPADLLGEARRWRNDGSGSGDGEAGVRSWLAATVAEAAVLAEWDGVDAARAAARARAGAAPAAVRLAGFPVVDAVVDAALDRPPARTGRDRPAGEVAEGILARLDAAAEQARSSLLPRGEAVALRLLACGWARANAGGAAALPALEALAADAEDLDDRRLALAVRDERAFALVDAGRRDEGVAAARAVLDERVRVLGEDDPDTLTTRAQLAGWLAEPAYRRPTLAGESGDVGSPQAARDELSDIVQRTARTLGPDHRQTLALRTALARWTGEAGDAASARDQCAALAEDRRRVLGPTHPATLVARSELARWTGRAGDAQGAAALLRRVVEDGAIGLGPRHRDTLVARANLAHWTGMAGEPGEARVLYAALVPEATEALGSPHVDTLAVRLGAAYWTGRAGDAVAACEAARALHDECRGSLGPDHPLTLACGAVLARWAAPSASGDTALGATYDALAAYARQLGAEHPITVGYAREFGALLAERSDAPEVVNQLVIGDLSRLPRRVVEELVGSVFFPLARSAVRLLLDEPSAGRAQVADLLGRFDRGPGIGLVLGMAAIAGVENLTGAEHAVVDALVRAGATDRLVPALASGCVGPGTLSRVLAALAGRAEPSLELATRLLAAAVALLDGDEEPLARLPHEERRLARAMASPEHRAS